MPSPERAGEHSQGFRQLDEETRLRGWRITLTRASFEAPDGTTFTRDVVRHPGAVAIVPVTERGTALLVRQYRGPVDGELLEIPAGTRDVDGEGPEETAHRELAEEVGVRAGSMRLLGSVFNSPGFCDEETFVFLATGLQPDEAGRLGHDEQGPEERFMEVVEVPLAQVDDLIASRRLNDAQTVIGLLLARDILRR